MGAGIDQMRVSFDAFSFFCCVALHHATNEINPSAWRGERESGPGLAEPRARVYYVLPSCWP
jgi:hypothetical protein